MSKQSNMPKLRFKEFVEEWSKIILGDLLTFKNGLNSDKEKYGKGIKFINVLDILNNNFITYDNIIGSVEVTEKEFEKNEVSYGDILFQRSSETRAEVGQANVYLDRNKSSVFGGFVIRGKAKYEYDPLFMNYLLRTPIARKEITDKSGGSTRYNVGQDTLSQVQLTTTTLPEQEKIATFLSAVDEKIQQLTSKAALLEQYKKGVMQQLFSGKLRFKDDNGEEYADWEEKKLGDTLEITIDNRGKTPPTLERGIPLLEVNSIGNKEIKYELVSKYVTEQTYESWFRKHLKEGDILFSTVGNTALCSYYDGINKACIAQNIVGLRFKIDFSLFMYYLLTEKKNNNKFKQIEMGAVQPSVKVSQMVDLLFKIPSLPEQQKIAGFLSGIDEKIGIVQGELLKMQGFKKGLLQQMFV